MNHFLPPRSIARNLSNTLAVAALLPSLALPATLPPGPTPTPPQIACPCDYSDWAVQSVAELPSRVPSAIRNLRVRIANVGPGIAPGIPAKIDVWSQGDPFDGSDDFILSTERCGLIYTVSFNGIPWAVSSLAVPSIASGSHVDLIIPLPQIAGEWSVDVVVLPKIQFLNKYQQVVPLPECYGSVGLPPWQTGCVHVSPDWNNFGHWETP